MASHAQLYPMNADSEDGRNDRILVLLAESGEPPSWFQALQRRPGHVTCAPWSPHRGLVTEDADLIAVDAAMPEPAIAALAEQVAAEDNAPPLLLVGGDIRSPPLRRLLENPGNDVVREPVVPEELFARVRSLVSLRRHRVALDREARRRRLMEAAFEIDEQRLEALAMLVRNRSRTERVLIDYAVEAAVQMTCSSAGYMHFVDPGERALSLYTWDRNTQMQCRAGGNQHYPIDDAGVWADCLRERRPVTHNDYPRLPRRRGYPEGHIPIERHMSVPIFDQDRIVAIAGVGNKQTRYDDSDVRQLDLFMSSVWQIVQRHRAEAQLRRVNDELEERVRQRTSELQRANEALAAEVEQRRRVEEALRLSEERYELATDAGRAGVWDWHIETGDMYIAPKLKALLGYGDEEIADEIDAWSAHVHPQDSEGVARAIDRHLSGQAEAFEVVHRMCHRDGSVRWLLARGRAIRDDDGRPVRLVGTDTDITDHRKMAETIESQHAFLRSVIEALAHPFYVIDVDDYRIRLANSAAQRTGRGVGDKCHVTIHGSERPCHSADRPCPMQTVRETLEPVTLEHVHQGSDGELRVYEVRGYPIFDQEGRVRQMAEYTIDVTERSRYQQEIRRRNRELSLLNAVIEASTTDGGPEGVLEAACRELRRAFELDAATAVFCEPGQSHACVVEAEASARSGGIQRVRVDARTDPTLRRCFDANEALVLDEEGTRKLREALPAVIHETAASAVLVPVTLQQEQMGILVLQQYRGRRFDAPELDLTRRVADQVAGSLARARFAQVRRRLEAAVEQTGDAVVITDVEGTIAYVNPAFERVTGYRREEAVGQNPSILASGRQDETFYAQLWDTILAGQIWHGRFVNRAKSGALYTEDAVIAPVRNAAGEIVSFIGTKRDITRELELEEHVRHAQRMESIGRLAGGVAHDFNNMLAVILGYAGLALGHLSPDSPAFESIREIEDTAQRAATVTRQLLTFARRQVTEPRSLDLREVISSLDRMLDRIIGDPIEVRVLVRDDLWPVKVDRGQIEQVVVNLAINARDAMPKGGLLVIRLANLVISPEAPLGQDVEPGCYVEIAVQDTGVGMTDEVRSHAFEPFYTTKDREHGTGLGLASCFGIVKQSGGHIWAESTRGDGTTIRVLLPRTNGSQDMASAPPPDTPIQTGTETVFVVEDEQRLRKLACRLLENLGYAVLEAEDGEVALGIAQACLDDIDILVTDVTMPRMSGTELAQRLRARRPDLPVLFTSGYDPALQDLHGATPGAELLHKPYSPSALATRVRTILDSRVRRRGTHRHETSANS